MKEMDYFLYMDCKKHILYFRLLNEGYSIKFQVKVAKYWKVSTSTSIYIKVFNVMGQVEFFGR